MKHHYAHILWVLPVQGTRLAKNSMLFFGVMFLMFFSSFEVFGQTPTYDWIKRINAGNAGIDPEKIVVAITTDSKDNIYILTFGNGVFKFPFDGKDENDIVPFIESRFLESPLDIAIDSDDLIYVADYDEKEACSKNGKIRVFDLKGKPIISKIQYTNIYRPLGIDFDKNDNLYVAEFNPKQDKACETNEISRVTVYKKDGTSITNKKDLTRPFRIAVDSKNHVYISQAGLAREKGDESYNGSVIILDQNLKYEKKWNIPTPGSVVVDANDYIHVIDYNNKVDFNAFLQLSIPAIIGNINPILNGIKNNEFGIRIYNSFANDNDYINVVEDKNDEIDFPFDLTFSNCSGNMIVNDLVIPNFTLKFDLEFFNRTPNFDTEKPKIISCVPDQNASLTNGEFILPDYTGLAVFNAVDNCDKELTIIQDPPMDTSIFQTETVTITATDDAGNISEACAFKVIVEDATDTEPPVITCPTVITKNVDSGQCGAVVTFANATATDNSGIPPTITRIDNTGLNSGDFFPVGETIISFRATDGAELTDECSFIITVIDNEKPTISCPDPISETVAFGEIEKVITYTTPIFGDNCTGSTIMQTEGFASGSDFPVGITTNTFVVTDASNNTSTCSFDVTIAENTDTEKPEITCPANITKNIDSGKCGAIVTFADATATDNSGNVTVRLISTLPSGSEFPIGKSIVSFEAKDAAGNISECSFEITVNDNIPPTVSCPQDILVEYTTEKTYTVSDFSTLYASSDNCSSTLSYSQNPAPNTVITDDFSASFSVGDKNNNFTTCKFNIKFIKSTELQITNCPTSRSFEVDEDCSYLVPDIASTIETNLEGATVTQDIAPGFRLNGSHRLTITAKFEDQIATCEIELIAKDNIDPVVICPANQNETFNPENGFSLPNYILLAQTSDNCAVAKIEQIPDVGTVIFEDTEVTLRVEDLDGNVASCAFQVFLNEETVGNTPPVAKDDAYVTAKDISLTVSSPGVLGNDSDEDGDELTAVIQSPPASGTLAFNSDGSFTYTPNSGFTGGVTFTYAANDGTENSNIASVTITVTEPSGDAVVCKESLTIGLDENGIANLNASELFISRPENLQFSVNKEIFTCDELGENTVTLSYSNNEVQASCDVTIIVKDVSAPILGVKDISVALNEFGSVSITPEMLDNGSSDNCGELSLSVDKSDFGCKELGENTVNFTATDASGNSSSTTARVIITGNCNINPFPGVEYIFIYPNPTSGPFQFATPTGVTIQRVEVFDARGRMVMFKEYSEAALQYNMDLSGVQSAVYILKLFTSEGMDIKRVLIN